MSTVMSEFVQAVKDRPIMTFRELRWWLATAVIQEAYQHGWRLVSMEEDRHTESVLVELRIGGRLGPAEMLQVWIARTSSSRLPALSSSRIVLTPGNLPQACEYLEDRLAHGGQRPCYIP